MGESLHSLERVVVFLISVLTLQLSLYISVNACETENPLSKFHDRLSEVSVTLFLALMNCNCLK